MEKVECDICGKVIEGYKKSQVDFLLDQHKQKHEREKLKEKAK